MTNLALFSFKKAETENRESKISEILRGLGEEELGFLLAAPGMGKTNVSLSISFEVALATPILGLIPENSAPKKVLFLPYEDKTMGLYSKIKDTAANFSDEQKAMIESNFDIYTKFDPLFLNNIPNQEAVNELIETCKGFDLLILDTARASLGMLDDVEGDIPFRILLEKIRHEAKIAILVNHHLTKNQIDERSINSSGGSGLSTTQSLSKYHLFLSYSDKNKKEKILTHTKHNYINEGEIFSRENPLRIKYVNNMIVSDLFNKQNALTDHVSEQRKDNIDTLKKQQQERRNATKDRLLKKFVDEAKDEELLKEMENEPVNNSEATTDIWDDMFLKGKEQIS